MSDQKPAVGRIVHYKLSSIDVELIDQRCPQRDENDGLHLLTGGWV